MSKSPWDDVAMVMSIAAAHAPYGNMCWPRYPEPPYPLVAHRRRNAAQRAKRRARTNRK